MILVYIAIINKYTAYYFAALNLQSSKKTSTDSNARRDAAKFAIVAALQVIACNILTKSVRG